MLYPVINFMSDKEIFWKNYSVICTIKLLSVISLPIKAHLYLAILIMLSGAGNKVPFITVSEND